MCCIHKVAHKFHRLLIPISCEENVLGIIRIDSLESLETYKGAIEAFAMVYENYLAILNESERDKLTGLLNRRTFEKKLDRLLKSQKIHQEEYVAPDKELERRDIIPALTPSWP